MGYKVVVAGATGNVGREMLNILEEVNFPVEKIHAIASRKSIGMEVNFGDKIIRCEDVEQFADHVLGAADHLGVGRELGLGRDLFDDFHRKVGGFARNAHAGDAAGRGVEATAGREHAVLRCGDRIHGGPPHGTMPEGG